MKEKEFRDIVNQNVLVQHLIRELGSDIYADLYDKKSLKLRRKEIVKELDKLIKMANDAKK